MTDSPIIDTHQHLWDLSLVACNWMTDNTLSIARSFRPADYAAAIDGLGVVKSIYMEVDVRKDLLPVEADYATGICESGSTTMVAAVIGGYPAEEGFAAWIKPFAGHRHVKGIRQVIHEAATAPGYCLSDEFVAGVRLLGESGLTFDICIRPEELADAAELISRCPGTRFVLDHCGNANVHHSAEQRERWKRDLALVAARPNVVCKVSGVVASAKPGAWSADDLAPIVDHTMDLFGPDRVMFGGDWPVCTLAATYREWVTVLKQIVSNRPEAHRHRLFHDNAEAFYGV